MEKIILKENLTEAQIDKLKIKYCLISLGKLRRQVELLADKPSDQVKWSEINALWGHIGLIRDRLESGSTIPPAVLKSELEDNGG